MEKSIPVQLSMFAPTSSEGSRNVISLPGLADGPSPFDSLNGQTHGSYGAGLAPVSPFQPPERRRDSLTSDISGPSGSSSSTPVGPPSFSESKSPEKEAFDGLVARVRTCRLCKIEKSYSEFYVNSKGNRGRVCKDCVCRLARRRKRGEPHKCKVRFHEWRRKNRGRALVTVAKNRARVRQLPFDLDAGDIQRRIDRGVCELTGISFDLTSPRSWNAPSLDQIRPGKGYTKDNVRVVLYSLNVMANVWGVGTISLIASAITTQRRARSSALQDSLTAKLKAHLPTDDHPLFSLTWKERVTGSGRRISALRASARTTSDNASGSWPTPMAGTPTTDRYNYAGSTDYERRIDVLLGLRETLNSPKVTGWPTPSETDESSSRRHGYMDDGQPRAAVRPQKAVLTGHAGTTLTDAASLAGWPTSRGSDAEIIRTPEGAAREWARKGLRADLPTLASLAGWPTPTAVELGNTLENYTAMKAHMKSGPRTAITHLSITALLTDWPRTAARDPAASIPTRATAATPRAGSPSRDATTLTLSGWPPPNVPNGGRSVPAEWMDATGRTPDGIKHTASLEHVAKFAQWPTPQSRDWLGGGLATRAMGEGRHGSNLPDFAMLTTWPTPRAEDSEQTGAHRGYADTLTSASRLAAWATPTSRDHKDGNSEGTAPTNALLGRQVWEIAGSTSSGSPVATGKRGQLNPSLSRWLMGYPPAWDTCAIRVRIARGSRRSSPTPPTASAD